MGKSTNWLVGGCVGCAVAFIAFIVIGVACYFGWQYYDQKQKLGGSDTIASSTASVTDDDPEYNALSDKEKMLVGRWDYRKMQYEKKEDMHIAFNAVFDFQKNYGLSADGTLKVSVASTITAIYKLTGEGTWRLDGDALVLDFSDINVDFIKYTFDGNGEMTNSQTRKIERTLKNDVCKELRKQLKGENRSIISTLTEDELTTTEDEVFKKIKD